MELALLPLVLGINIVFWSLIGGIRLAGERLAHVREVPAEPPGHHRREQSAQLCPLDVAVLIPAHNEELVIAATIDSVVGLVPADNVHVVADGCRDATAEIARAAGVHVLELEKPHGKAGGIEMAIEHFDIPPRFAALLIVDADTIVDDRYLLRGLPMLDRPGVIALAGYAKAGWRPQEFSLTGRFIAAYRARLYTIMQWLKYAQTWRWTNVTPIVPGFASMYRTSALAQMELNPPGLVIEDFNMTFEVHHKRLGKIAFHPGVKATTQEPDNLADYVRQIGRWNLGFWQTLRRHGLWPSGFCVALVLFVTEVLVASIGLVVLAGAVVTIVATAAVVSAGTSVLWLLDVTSFIGSYLSFASVLLFLAIPDYLLTCITAIALRRPSLLLYGVGFLPLRMVDAASALITLPQTWLVRSTGSWTSPTRRPALSARAAEQMTGHVPPAVDNGPDGPHESDDTR